MQFSLYPLLIYLEIYSNLFQRLFVSEHFKIRPLLHRFCCFTLCVLYLPYIILIALVCLYVMVHVMCVSCLVGYIMNVDCGGDIGHVGDVGDVGHLFGVLCLHCTCLPVSVNTLHRKESVVSRVVVVVNRDSG